MREAFGKQLVQLGEKCERVVVLDADLCGSTKAVYFRDRFPQRFIQAGIAEQNMMGVAAGLASTGFLPYVTTFSVFASRRACDQVSVSIAYTGLNVRICGGYSGLSSGKAGSTHQSIDDIAIMRAMPNMTVIAPADDNEIRAVLEATLMNPGPVYIRIGRNEIPTIFSDKHQFIVGKVYRLTQGNDVAIIASGTATSRAIDAAKILESHGISARVIHVPTLKPIIPDEIVDSAREIGMLLTVEDHSIIGGLGDIVGSTIAEHGVAVQFVKLGIRDTFGESGSEHDLQKKFGISVEHIVMTAKTMCGRHHNGWTKQSVSPLLREDKK